MYLAYKYNHDPATALLKNTNLGGENCHRGSVLGSIVGLCSPNTADAQKLTNQLKNIDAIEKEISNFLAKA